MRRAWVISWVLVVAGLIGCQTTDGHTDLSERLRGGEKVTLLLVTETTPTRPADAELVKRTKAAAASEDCLFTQIDIGTSSARASALQYRATVTPLLVVISPGGVILSRDEAPLAETLIRDRAQQGRTQAQATDLELAKLQAAMKADPTGPEPHRKLAAFYLAHRNAREAIPHLQVVAHSQVITPAVRVAATVDLCRSHLWIGEPEKSRHEARDLVAGLGSTYPDAIAAGNLIFATQDITAKRVARAREELQTAIAAAPASDYGRQAAELLKTLPKEGK